MTLHWWMHWFWVTLLITIVGSGSLEAAPQAGELERISDIHTQPPKEPRQGRAMYFPKTTPQTVAANATEVNSTEKIDTVVNNTSPNDPPLSVAPEEEQISAEVAPTVQWTAVNTSDLNSDEVKNATNSNSTAPMEANSTDIQNTTFTKKRNLTRQEFVKDGSSVDGVGVSESRIVTEKPLSLETTFLQTRIPPNIESSRRINDHEVGMDTGVIAGISFAALVLAALAGSTAFVLYRRRYLNKPQTLNDKCSNPDSSGYLDDSTIRDNSEEMYSLDNDSFLNSLEAMTIQNYWTDTVKHTKL